MLNFIEFLPDPIRYQLSLVLHWKKIESLQTQIIGSSGVISCGFVCNSLYCDNFFTVFQKSCDGTWLNDETKHLGKLSLKKTIFKEELTD